MDIKLVERIVYAPITLEELHFWYPPDPGRQAVVEAVHDSKRNTVNFGISGSDHALSA